MKEDILLSVVVPLYNEGQVVLKLLDELENYLSKLGASHEIILVDDGSKDGTWDLIKDRSKLFPNIKGVRFTSNYGKEAAIFLGLKKSRGDAVFVVDGDLQHPLNLIPEMYKEWRANRYKVVNAVKREVKDQSIVKYYGNRLFYFLLESFTKLNLDKHSDYKLLDREVVNALLELPERNRFFRGLVAWLDYPSKDIYFDVNKRSFGRTRWSLYALIKLAFDAITGFTSAPLRLMTIASLVFFILLLLVLLQTLYVYLSGKALEGFTTIIVLLLLIGAVISLGLGIIGEYLARIYDEVKKRPMCIVGESVNLD